MASKFFTATWVKRNARIVANFLNNYTDADIAPENNPSIVVPTAQVVKGFLAKIHQQEASQSAQPVEDVQFIVEIRRQNAVRKEVSRLYHEDLCKRRLADLVNQKGPGATIPAPRAGLSGSHFRVVDPEASTRGWTHIRINGPPSPKAGPSRGSARNNDPPSPKAGPSRIISRAHRSAKKGITSTTTRPQVKETTRQKLPSTFAPPTAPRITARKFAELTTRANSKGNSCSSERVQNAHIVKIGKRSMGPATKRKKSAHVWDTALAGIPLTAEPPVLDTFDDHIEEVIDSVIDEAVNREAHDSSESYPSIEEMLGYLPSINPPETATTTATATTIATTATATATATSTATASTPWASTSTIPWSIDSLLAPNAPVPSPSGPLANGTTLPPAGYMVLQPGANLQVVYNNGFTTSPPPLCPIEPNPGSVKSEGSPGRLVIEEIGQLPENNTLPDFMREPLPAPAPFTDDHDWITEFMVPS